MAIKEPAIDTNSVVYGPVGEGQRMQDIPRIQLSEETPNPSDSRRDSSDLNLRSEREIHGTGHFVATDDALEGSIHDSNTAE